MKTPVTKAVLKQHFTYYWWLYVLIAALSALGINLLYTVTAYRIPDDRKIRLIVYGLTNPEYMDGYMESVHNRDFPEMELMECERIIPDETNGLSTLSTKIYSREGDLYVLPMETFISYAESGVLLPLEDDAELNTILGDDAALTRGWRTLNGTNESHLFGVPLEQLPGLQYYVYAERGFICIANGSTNREVAKAFLRIICRDMQTVPETIESDTAEAETASPSSETP